MAAGTDLPVRVTAGPRPDGAVVDPGARMPAFVGYEGDVAAAVGLLRFAVAGAGSVGRRIAFHVARMHPAALLVVDPSRYKAQSLLTQEIGPDDVGRPKASGTAALAAAIAPECDVRAFDGPLQALDLSVLSDFDMVFLATDNLAAEGEAGRRATALGIPLVQASVEGRTMTAQARVFRNLDGEGPCPLCAYGPDEWRHMTVETRFACGGPAAEPTEMTATPPPTVSVSALCSLAADLAVLQALRLTLGLGAPVGDTLLELNAFTWRGVVTPLRRRPHCPSEHGAWELRAAPSPLRDCTLEGLARTAGVPPSGMSEAAFTVGGTRFYESVACGCGPSPLERFLPAPIAQGTCDRCDQLRRPDAFASHRCVPGEVLLSDLGRPLGALASVVPWVTIRHGSTTTLFRPPPDGRIDR